MKTYTAANDSEARSLHDGTQTLVVVPMRQPPTGCVYLMNANGDKACCYYQFSDLGNYTGPCWVPPTPTSTDHLLPAPYVPGDVVGVKEAWRPLGNCYRRKFGPQIDYESGEVSEWCPNTRYFADDTELQDYLTGKCDKWQSADSMPDWAIRTRLSIVRVEAKRVQEIAGEQIFALGVDNGGSNPTMGKRYENMQQMAFENEWDSRHPSLPWSSNPWAWFYVVEAIR